MSELDKLVAYLKEHHIRYRRVDEESNILKCEGFDICPDRHQVIVYDANGNRAWDAICQWGSYGYDEGLLEISGNIVSVENDVEGWLTADDIIERLRTKA